MQVSPVSQNVPHDLGIEYNLTEPGGTGWRVARAAPWFHFAGLRRAVRVADAIITSKPVAQQCLIIRVCALVLLRASLRVAGLASATPPVRVLVVTSDTVHRSSPLTTMAGGYLNQLWEDSELSPDRPRYLPLADTFPDEVPNLQAQQHGPHFPVQLPHPEQYSHPEQLFQQPTPLIPLSAVEDLHSHEPYTSSTFQDPFNRAFIHNQPVVHEGYIPAPDTRDEDLYPNLPDGYRDSLFQDYDDSSDESDFERRLAEAEELREIEERDDSEVDADYSEEDAEQDEGDPNEMEIDETYVEERKGKRGKLSARGTRGGRRGRPPGRGKGGFHGPTRKQLRGKKNPGRPSGKRGPRPIADPGPEFRSLQRAANERFIAQDYPAALEYGQKAVQLNPEIFDAHNIVAESYAAMGEELKSIESLIIGAPTKRDPELWHLIIERIKKLDTTDHPTYTEEVKTAVVLQCLKSIIALDVTNYEARSLKLEIEARLGHVSKCVNLGTKMLKTLREHKQDPDTEVLKIMAMMGTSTPKQTRRHLTKIIDEFDQAIDIYTGPNRDPKTSDLDWELINIYLDLLDRTGKYDDALKRLKDLSRWKQGRRNETYWDEQTDDREFDLDDAPRRVEVFDFKRKSKSAKYGEALPLEIRVKMGLFRLRRSADDYAEAMYHLEMLGPDDNSPDAIMWDYLDLFRVIADALHATGHDADALRFYEPLLESNSSEMSLMSYLGLYTVYKNLDQPEKAQQIIPILVGWTADTVDDLAVLAKFFEVHDMPQEAMERADACYRNRGLVKLRRIGYSRLREIRSHYEDWRRKSRGNHGKKKNAMRKQRKLMKKAIAALDDDDDEEGSDKERPSLAPSKERPAEGLFRTKRSAPKPPRTQTFLPFDVQAQQGSITSQPRTTEPMLLEGTGVPMDAIDHRLFRKKLQKLAEDNADDVTTARAQHREIVASFQKLDDVYNAAEDGSEDATNTVFSITRELIEEFSTFDLFYADKKEDFKGYFRRIGAGEIWKESALMVLAVAANNVEDGETSPELREKPDSPPQDFWGIHFDPRWTLDSHPTSSPARSPTTAPLKSPALHARSLLTTPSKHPTQSAGSSANTPLAPTSSASTHASTASSPSPKATPPAPPTKSSCATSKQWTTRSSPPSSAHGTTSAPTSASAGAKTASTPPPSPPSKTMTPPSSPSTPTSSSPAAPTPRP
ncbi:hypothetical protein OPT61_g9835 [Boeremia exigua]|uniref:Uncharacterized protein n=1 Tax=Boeremia exigua TaxID=749465 RepID=A0ACC2HSC9_9PLEO|nr:hypothetical protein OPT61_g9835 [Boeremia exigua]